MSFFTLSRIYFADGKRAGQKGHRKIAAAVQNVKPLYFLSRSFEIREKYGQESFFCLDHQTDHYQGDGGFRDGGIRDGEIVDGEIVEGGCQETFLCLSFT